LKKLDKFILKSYAGPYILSFFIAEFVLIMQFLWKYIDDILGKGFTMFEILELILYYGASIVPMALPISILLASVMVFGDISEKYELSSMKSAGISLLRIMRPAIILSLFTFLFSIFASNFLKPIANYQFKKRFELIRRQKSTLSIEEGIFNNEFSNLVIRIGKKAENQKDVKDVLIYDHSMPDKSLINMIKSDSAEMYSTEDGKYFVMNMKKGNQYQELERNRVDNGKIPYQLVRTSFDKWSKIVDMSEFYLSESDMNVSRNREDMLNSFQLKTQIDSMNSVINKTVDRSKNTYLELTSQKSLTQVDYEKQLKARAKYEASLLKPKVEEKIVEKKNNEQIINNSKEQVTTENAMSLIKAKQQLMAKKNKGKIVKNQIPGVTKSSPIFNSALPATVQNSTHIKKDTIHFKRINYDVTKVGSFYETLDSLTKGNLITKALPFVSANIDIANSSYNTISYSFYQKQILILRLGQQYSFAVVCILFLFIGAPLGSIIRKGGFGYPLLIAILFYILFIISTIVGEKLLKSESILGWVGAWLPCLILLPFSFYFTYQAINDVRFTFIEKIETKISKWMSDRKERRIAKRVSS
jgi:lipopolysaccharide export system permease protein